MYSIVFHRHIINTFSTKQTVRLIFSMDIQYSHSKECFQLILIQNDKVHIFGMIFINLCHIFLIMLNEIIYVF